MVAKKESIDDISRALNVLGGSAILGSETRDLRVIPTNIPDMNDEVFGVGGLPMGRVIELYAKESIGKSTLAYWLMGQVQKAEGVVALFDAEGAYRPDYGEGCGINNERLILPEFSHGEEALGQMKMLIATGAVDLIVADAMPAFQPLVALAQVAGAKVTMNIRLERAKMYTMFFNDMLGGFKIKPAGKNATWVKDVHGRIKRKLYQTNTTLIFINHSKDKVGVMFGERTYTPGGDAINFATALRIGMTKAGKKHKKVGGKKVLNYKVVKVKAAKNKLAIPFGEALIRMYPDGRLEPAQTGDGYDKEEEDFPEEVEVK